MLRTWFLVSLFAQEKIKYETEEKTSKVAWEKKMANTQRKWVWAFLLMLNCCSEQEIGGKHCSFFLILLQSYPEAWWKVQGHFKDCSWYHSECVSAARHGEEESHPAHQGTLQDGPQRQPPLARAGATTHSRPVCTQISFSHWQTQYRKVQQINCFCSDDNYPPAYFIKILMTF